MESDLSFSEKCEAYLLERWNYIQYLFNNKETNDLLNDKYLDLKEKIKICLKSKTKSYRYVLPTQLLCKSVNHSLDCRSLQASFSSSGAFDARTIAHKVIVPFDSANHDVLGGSREPYVNNPLRCTSVTVENRERQKNKLDWDNLVFILNYIESIDDENFTRKVFDQLLLEIYKLLSEVIVVYPTPNRISLDRTLKLLSDFISERSGGERLESVVAALFKTIQMISDYLMKLSAKK